MNRKPPQLSERLVEPPGPHREDYLCKVKEWVVDEQTRARNLFAPQQ